LFRSQIPLTPRGRVYTAVFLEQAEQLAPPGCSDDRCAEGFRPLSSGSGGLRTGPARKAGDRAAGRNPVPAR
jgi:hypothetical protein